MTDTTRKLVDEVVVGHGLGLGISAALSKKFSRQAHLKTNSLRSCGFKLVGALLAQGCSPENVVDQLWLMAFGEIGVLGTTVHPPVLPVKFALTCIVLRSHGVLPPPRQCRYLDPSSRPRAEAQRLTSPFRVVRYPTSSITVERKAVTPNNIVVLTIVRPTV